MHSVTHLSVDATLVDALNTHPNPNPEEVLTNADDLLDELRAYLAAGHSPALLAQAISEETGLDALEVLNTLCP